MKPIIKFFLLLGLLLSSPALGQERTSRNSLVNGARLVVFAETKESELCLKSNSSLECLVHFQQYIRAEIAFTAAEMNWILAKENKEAPAKVEELEKAQEVLKGVAMKFAKILDDKYILKSKQGAK